MPATDPSLVGVEWPAAAGPGWPFAPAATFRDADGGPLPYDLLADLVLHPAGAAGPCHLQSLAAGPDGVRVGFADPTRTERAHAVVPPGSAGPVAVWDPAGRSAGALVPGAGLAAAGDRRVAPDGLPVDPGACLPHPAAGGVTALVDAAGEGHDGVVTLVAGAGVRFAVESGLTPDGRPADRLVVSAVGDVFGGPGAECLPGGPAAGPVLRAVRVEGVGPDGQPVAFTVAPDPGGLLRVASTAGGVATASGRLKLSRGSG